jgi:hypothetical protein
VCIVATAPIVAAPGLWDVVRADGACGVHSDDVEALGRLEDHEALGEAADVHVAQLADVE